MTILFAVVDGGGNVPPQLRVAATLQARGIDVAVVGHPGIAERVRAAGLPFEAFAGVRPWDPTRQRPLAVMMADFVRMAGDPALGRAVLEAARRRAARAVVVDMILSEAVQQVHRGLPTAVFVHCFYRAVQDLAAGPPGWALRARGVDPHYAEHRGLLQLVAARADLDPARGRPAVVHTGVVWQGTPVAARPREVPQILVSLSTNAFAGQHRMLQHILDALAPVPAEVTVTVGPSIDAAGLRVPANAALHDWLDHDEVLATTSLVVGHGGHSTAMRALSFGVPQVVLPANALIDQKAVGAALRDRGAGLLLSKHARPQRIRRAVETVLRHDRFTASAARLGEDIRLRDGAEVAADRLAAWAQGQAGAP
jgi:UDP:flavonoid glycosyltransferase YjiC (YdhE family)